MKATIKDIAKSCGVSTATVSRVLNGVHEHNEKTVAAVNKAAEELGYQRNEVARSLVSRNSRTLGVIIPDVATSFYGELVKGIESVAYKNNYAVILSHSGINGDRMVECLKSFGERQMEGILIVSVQLNAEHYQELKKLNIPYLLLSTNSFKYQSPYIKVDDYAASYSATQYLISRGHRSIAIVGSNAKDQISGVPRVEGYKLALEENGIQVNDNLICYGDYSFHAGEEGMNQLLKSKEVFTAVFGVSDDVAAGVITVARNHGIEVPKDLSVMGYDDTKLASMFIPKLTTLRQPFAEMGEKGALKMIGAIENGQEMISEIVSYEIVERDSIVTI